MTTEDDRIYDLAQSQAAMNSDLLRAVSDVNAIGNVVRSTEIRLDKRDDEISAKIDELKTDLRIYKALSAVIAAGVTALAWIVSNIENIKGIFK